jgi:O-acetyl-ADP-ribose deacetylase (regulator of RNase III)
MAPANITVVRGSLVDQNVDAIVNAANTLMRGGGGIDGLIHQRAGFKMLLELQRVAPRGCETGEVVVTPGFDLPQQWVIHTPGPIWRGGKENEDELLANSYRNSMVKAIELNVKSIAFCSISTGVYGFPIERAAPIALDSIMAHADQLESITFAMFGAAEYETFRDALNRH